MLAPRTRPAMSTNSSDVGTIFADLPISAHIGNDYRRVRLGIGHPGVKELVHGHVLSDFAKADNDWVATLCDAVAEHAALIAKGTDATFANRVHLAMQAKGFLTKDDNGKE